MGDGLLKSVIYLKNEHCGLIAIKEVKSKLAVTGASDLKNKNPAERGISKL